MDSSDGDSEDQNTDRDVNSKHCPHEVLDKNNDSIGILNKDCVCYIVVKNISPFYPSPESFWKAELKTNVRG